MYHTLTIHNGKDGGLITTAGYSHMYIDQGSPCYGDPPYRDVTLRRGEHRIAVRTFVSLPIEAIQAIAAAYLEDFPNCYNRKETKNARRSTVRR